jgi:hypothetical protein
MSIEFLLSHESNDPMNIKSFKLLQGERTLVFISANYLDKAVALKIYDCLTTLPGAEVFPQQRLIFSPRPKGRNGNILRRNSTRRISYRELLELAHIIVFCQSARSLKRVEILKRKNFDRLKVKGSIVIFNCDEFKDSFSKLKSRFQKFDCQIPPLPSNRQF